MRSQSSLSLEQAEARDLDRVFAGLRRSNFRRRFSLGPAEARYLAHKGLPTILEHGRTFVEGRLAPARPAKDGKQTPYRGHPFFIAQHATATCCRGCLEKWHGIARDRRLTEGQILHVLAAAERWLAQQPSAPTSPDQN